MAIRLSGGNWLWLSQIKAKNIDGKFYTQDTSKTPFYVENPTHKVKISVTMQLTDDFMTNNISVNMVQLMYNNIPTGANIKPTNIKIELGSTATPYMPSYSEATITDYPSYIGTYTGKIADGQSTDPVKYNWKKIN